MGDWDYYVVKMTTRELSDNVRFAHQVYDDRTLDEAIQRTLNEGRVRKEIVTYLSRQPARFFSSVVIAALHGDPKWYSVEIAEDDRFEIFRDDKRLNSTFGVLAFDGTQDYYALDGQHRLAAIKTLLDKNDPLSDESPPGFDDDELSVILVVPRLDESEETFMQRYRRLFSNLNRYAKPMDQATNIIMDEDDVFAIVTRRLIQEHEFFRWSGRQLDSGKVKTTKGKNLKLTDPYFTSIETLYAMNIGMLNSRNRRTHGWNGEGAGSKLKDFVRFRPSEEFVDQLYAELALYWDALLGEVPDLRQPPTDMRAHSADAEDAEQLDHLLFWPIGQELLSDLVRDLLDWRLSDPSGTPTPDEASEALQGLGRVNWDLHKPPWRNFLLTSEPASDGTDRWKMRSDDRASAIRISRLIVRAVLGIDQLSSEELEELRLSWQIRLVPQAKKTEANEMWEATFEIQGEI